MTDIIYKEKYVDAELLGKIISYIDKRNDDFMGGPIVDKAPNASSIGMEGCSDRPLRLEDPDNPMHELLQKLKNDLQDFYIHTGSIRYLYYPYGPHSDIRSSEQLIEMRKKYTNGYTFLIPLRWKEGYVPGTAFFDSPPKENQSLMIEHQDSLPELQRKTASKNFGVNKLITWKHPGDLVAWKNFRFHCSMLGGNWTYNEKEWCKEFISLETYRYKDN
tara:strand:- start:334 stop:987 length:654 start_codon:yes stop_codon:yes gene_type:complete